MLAFFREERVRRRMDKFRQMRESKREEREKEKAAGHSRQTRMEDFFRVTRKREQVNPQYFFFTNYCIELILNLINLMESYNYWCNLKSNPTLKYLDQSCLEVIKQGKLCLLYHAEDKE